MHLIKALLFSTPKISDNLRSELPKISDNLRNYFPKISIFQNNLLYLQ